MRIVIKENERKLFESLIISSAAKTYSLTADEMIKYAEQIIKSIRENVEFQNETI